MFTRILSRRLTMASAAATVSMCSSFTAHNEGSQKNGNHLKPVVTNLSKYEDLILLPGSANIQLAKGIADHLGVQLGSMRTDRFGDGEIHCKILDSVRGKHVFIIQSCSTPVNDNIMEILLAISCARRCGADRITAVIPYFGYKYHMRGNAISTKTSSRFLWSVSADFAKMLEVLGVDRVIALDLQRPGQGQEACFFSNRVPVESVSSVELLTDYVANNIDLGKHVVVVAPNSEFIKKARKFQKGLQERVSTIEKIDLAAFLHTDSASDSVMSRRRDNTNSTFLGCSNISGADVIIVDDVVETATTLSVLCRRLISDGAKRVFVVASHGLFTPNSMERIHASAIEKVIVTDSVMLPSKVSSKVVQVSVSKTLAQVVDTEFCSRVINRLEDEDEYNVD